MPPSAISKAAAVAGTSSSASGITVIRPGGYTPAPYQASSNDPICHEFVNTGACGRLSRGEVCRYRHLDANHPDVIADKVRQGKLPPSAIAGGLAPGAGFAAGAAPGVDPTTGLSDPGPQAQLCFDFINNGQCSRLVSGQGCRYRHLPPTHPDVIADRIRTGKMNPAMAGAALAGTGLGGADASVQAAVLMATRGATMAPSIGVSGGGAVADGAFAQAALAMPDPGPGVQLCFDFINRGMCSRLVRGENCRYRHLAANHPDVIADKIRQGEGAGLAPHRADGLVRGESRADGRGDAWHRQPADDRLQRRPAAAGSAGGGGGGGAAAAAAALAVAAAAAVVLAEARRRTAAARRRGATSATTTTAATATTAVPRRAATTGTSAITTGGATITTTGGATTGATIITTGGATTATMTGGATTGATTAARAATAARRARRRRAAARRTMRRRRRRSGRRRWRSTRTTDMRKKSRRRGSEAFAPAPTLSPWLSAAARRRARARARTDYGA